MTPKIRLLLQFTWILQKQAIQIVFLRILDENTSYRLFRQIFVQIKIAAEKSRSNRRMTNVFGHFSRPLSNLQKQANQIVFFWEYSKKTHRIDCFVKSLCKSKKKLKSHVLIGAWRMFSDIFLELYLIQILHFPNDTKFDIIRWCLFWLAVKCTSIGLCMCCNCWY